MCRRSIRRSRTYPPKSDSDHFARPIDSIGLSSETPHGFAITNLQAADEGELSICFTEPLGSIQEVALFDYGDDTPESLEGVDLHIPLPLTMPRPPPLGLALAGLIGVVLFRRRMAS